MTNPYVLSIRRVDDLLPEFQKIGVDWGGWSIMASKAFTRAIKLHKIPSFVANILKQEMLSLGGDVALSRGSITGHAKTTDCLVIGHLGQLGRLCDKLKRQPFGLATTGIQIRELLARDGRQETILDIKGKKIHCGRRTYVMGILNATPDSFSGDGIFKDIGKAVSYAQEMVKNGADILDIGGESSRPGAAAISTKEELSRVVPLLKRIVKTVRVPISIDTCKSRVAYAALDLGVAIVNDISALHHDKKMAKVVARAKASLILMHRKGSPRTMQKAPGYQDLMREIIFFLNEAVKKSLDSGVSEDRIMIDPGIGFGKTLGHNLEILRQLPSLKCLGRPILVGVSRKSFIGKVVKSEAAERVFGTAAAVTQSIAHGADIVRVHDVKEMKQVALMADALVRPPRG